MIRTFLLLACLPLAAQSVPAHGIFAYGSYVDAPGPKFAGGVSNVAQIAGSQAYSYSSIDFVYSAARVLGTQTRTGLATPVKIIQAGPYIAGFWMLGTAGVNASSTATTASFSGGFALTFTRSDGWSVFVDAQQTNTGKTAHIGVGYAWGK